MPIEREFKFILDPERINLDTLVSSIKNGFLNFSLLEIKQGFATPNNRIRTIDYIYVGGDREPKEYQKGALTSYVHTFKLEHELDVIELESDISFEDFEFLWVNASNKVHKYRLSSDNVGNYHWDVDFYLDDNNDVYFVLAECEVYDFGDARQIPSFVENALLYPVHKSNKMFTSFKLSNVNYAKETLSSLLEVKPWDKEVVHD